MTSARRVVWGVDLDGDAAGQRRVLALLDAWTLGAEEAIEPVHVLSAASAPARALAAERFAELVRGARLRLRPLRLLEASGPGLRDRVAALLTHAERSPRAAALALATHARRGPARWLYGSFTEAAVLAARLPLLTLNPSAAPPRRLERLLFATDLSPASSRALDRAVAEARARGLTVILAHCLDFDQSHPEAAYGPADDYALMRARDKANRLAKLELQAARARAKGVAVETRLLEAPDGISAALLEAASGARAQVVALAQRCGALEAALGGSITRKVIRGARCAVLALH